MFRLVDWFLGARERISSISMGVQAIDDREMLQQNREGGKHFLVSEFSFLSGFFRTRYLNFDSSIAMDGSYSPLIRTIYKSWSLPGEVGDLEDVAQFIMTCKGGLAGREWEKK